jgi:hypothetical protein
LGVGSCSTAGPVLLHEFANPARAASLLGGGVDVVLGRERCVTPSPRPGIRCLKRLLCRATRRHGPRSAFGFPKPTTLTSTKLPLFLARRLGHCYYRRMMACRAQHSLPRIRRRIRLWSNTSRHCGERHPGVDQPPSRRPCCERTISYRSVKPVTGTKTPVTGTGKMQTGTVKTFNSERGFGFITRDRDGTDIFFSHGSSRRKYR